MKINYTLNGFTRIMNNRNLLTIAAMAVMMIGAALLASAAGSASATSKRHNSIASSLENDCGNGKFLFNPQCQNTDASAIGDGSALAPVGLQEGGNQKIINQEEEAPPVTPPPQETGCNQAVTGFVALYDVILDQNLGGVHVAGNHLCLSGDGLIGNNNPFGFQNAFDVETGTVPADAFRVSVVEPIEGVCGGTPPFVHATVTSGDPRNQNIPITEVCIRGA